MASIAAGAGQIAIRPRGEGVLPRHGGGRLLIAGWPLVQQPVWEPADLEFPKLPAAVRFETHPVVRIPRKCAGAFAQPWQDFQKQAVNGRRNSP